MRARAGRFAAVALIPTAVDVGLTVWFRVGLGWPLIVADLAAIAVAGAVSYSAHRVIDFGSDPYSRWVQYPALFLAVAVPAALVDAAVLRLLFAATGFMSVGGVLAAKFVSLAVAVVARAAGYRLVLSRVVLDTQSRVPPARPPGDGRRRMSVVIPAYEEEHRIGATVAEVRSALEGIDAEIVVVDDGSRDRTARAAVDAGADQVVIAPANAGKGAAVRAGVLASAGRTVAFTDADLAYPPRQLRTILAQVEDGWDVVIGNRRHPDSIIEGGGGVRSLGSQVVNVLATVVLLAAPRDTQCGLKGFRGDVGRDLFARMRVDGFAFDIELLHLVERFELTLREIPVHLVDPGGSTVRIVRDVLRLGRDLVRVRNRSARGEYDRAAESVPAG